MDHKTNSFAFTKLLWVIALQLSVVFCLVSIPENSLALQCIDLFNNTPPEVSPYNGLPVSDSISAMRTIPGQHGGLRYVVKRTGQLWMWKRIDEYEWVKHAPHFVYEWFERKLRRRDGPTPQGDPHWFIELYGEKVAKFFGFEAISDTEMIVPTLDEFNRAVDKYNQMAKDAGSPFRLPIKGFATASREPDLHLVLQKFLIDGEVPVGKDRLFFHDMNFHLLMQLIHPDLMNLAKRQIKAVLDFDQYLQKNYGTLKRVPPFNKWFSFFVEFRTTHLDVGTGNSYGDSGKERRFEPDHANLVRGGMSRAYNAAEKGLAPGNYIRHMAHIFVEWFPSRVPGANKKLLSIVEKYLKTKTDENYWKDLEIDEAAYKAYVESSLAEMNRIIP